MEQKQQMSINIDPSVKPLFADEVAVACTIKQEKDEKGDLKKEGFVSLIFIDIVTHGTVARITMSKSTGKALWKILKTNLEDMEKQLLSKGQVAPVKIEGTSKDYIG
ncbi:MAG: hypothetical protein AABX33_05835 [Nanoarchaeota archaeon]